MTNGPNGLTGRAMRRLRIAALARTDGMTDGELMELFVAGRDEAAFEALVRRHGPMVLGVCRRILGDSHDAEDAFQAAFLVLVRRAASIVPREQVANWLYGVAYRTASKARSMNAKRRAKEARAPHRPAQVAPDDGALRDLLPVLDRELQALPDKYRLAIVLCDLEGKPRKEAARHLGWPEGTLSSRLATGRKLLARRLERRGHGLPAAGLPLLLAHAAPEAVPLALVATTVRIGLIVAAGQGLAGAGTTVAGLADAVLQGMLSVKLKVMLPVLVTCALVLAGVRCFDGQPDRPRGDAPVSVPAALSPPAPMPVARAIALAVDSLNPPAPLRLGEAPKGALPPPPAPPIGEPPPAMNTARVVVVCAETVTVIDGEPELDAWLRPAKRKGFVVMSRIADSGAFPPTCAIGPGMPQPCGRMVAISSGDLQGRPGRLVIVVGGACDGAPAEETVFVVADRVMRIRVPAMLPQPPTTGRPRGIRGWSAESDAG
jgi:RNA polymerase sigma factor (sigma-70 family)